MDGDENFKMFINIALSVLQQMHLPKLDFAKIC